MKCLICERPLKHAKQSECECGESLVFWTAQTNASQALRQRGLQQAAKKEYVSATVSFLEAALANPADECNLVDASKALASAGYYVDARQLLENADGRYDESKEQTLKVIRALEKRAKGKPPPAPPPPADKPSAKEPGPEPERPAEPAAPAAPIAVPAATPAAPPALAPLLGLGALKRESKSWLKRVIGKKKNRELPAVWSAVLQMEQRGASDWRALVLWAQTAAAEAARSADGAASDPAVFHYMLGLAHVQAGETDAAIAAFRRCLDLKPPVLNPAIYFLYVHLKDMENIQQALGQLDKELDDTERETCRRQLLGRLVERGETARAALLKQA